MTCNNVILAAPQAEGHVNYTIPAGDSARLNFTPDEISGIRMGEGDSLIISFENGGTLTIANFQDMVDDGSLMYLADGTLIDPSVLTNTLQSPQVLKTVDAQLETNQGLVIAKPLGETKQEVALTEGEKYICDFDPSTAAHIEIEDGKMILTFKDGSQVILNNYSEMMAGELPPELTLADGAVINTEELLTETTEVQEIVDILEEVAEVANIEPAAGEPQTEEVVGEEDLAALAEELADIETAAGETSSSGNSGYGFNSSPVDVPLNSPDAIGPLDPTRLQYNAPNGGNENIFLSSNAVNDVPTITGAEESLDETNIGSGHSASGQLVYSYGNDGVGSLELSGSPRVSGSLAKDTLSSGGTPVTITETEDGYVGVAGDTPVFTFRFDSATGEYEFTQTAPIDHADASNSDDIIDINFDVVIKDANGDSATSTIRIGIADDAPVATSQIAQMVDETNFNGGSVSVEGKFSALQGNDVVENGYCVNGKFKATGSVANDELTSNGEKVVVINNENNTYTGMANGQTVFTVTLNQNTGEYVYEQFLPLDHADSTDPNDQITLQFGIKIVDYDGDSDSGFVTVHVKDDGPSVEDSRVSVDETDGRGQSVSGTVDLDAGADGGTVDINASKIMFCDADGKALDMGGISIVESNTAENTFIGVGPNDARFFTLSINPETGDYTYTQIRPFDHADSTNPNDAIIIKVPVIATDRDGDTDKAEISITVLDDGPEATNDFTDVDRTETSIEGNVLDNDNFGADGEAAQAIIKVSFRNDDAITMGLPDADGSITIKGNFGDLVLAQDGSYTYTRNDLEMSIDKGRDHFVYTIQDGDGDLSEAVLAIDVVKDHTPIEISGVGETDDTNVIGSASDVETGTINVNTQGDGFGTTTARGTFTSSGNQLGDDLSSNGSPVTVTNSGNTYTGTSAAGDIVFTMRINANGTYRFEQFENLDHSNTSSDNEGINLFFGVTATDADGDTGNGNVRILVRDDGINVEDSHVSVDETDGRGQTVSGNVGLDLGADGGSVDINASKIMFCDQDGKAIDIGSVSVIESRATPNTFVGLGPNDASYFSLTLNPETGEYTYTQIRPFDHSDSTNPNDAIIIKVPVIATDGDGDTDKAEINITVFDDGPQAVNDGDTVTEGDTATGNILTNDTAGADGDKTVTQVTFNGVNTPVPATGTASVTGNFGTLVIAADGSYTYTPNSNDPSGTDVFTYTMRDGDGDTDTANLSIVVSPDAEPIGITGSGKTDDTSLGADSLATANGTINVNYQGDGPGITMGNGNFTSSGNKLGGQLSHNGTDINVTFNASNNTYTGRAGSKTVFTMRINEDGTYNFRQLDNLDHSVTTNNDEPLYLNFGVKATDADGDVGNGTVRITVDDDGPSAANDSASISRSGTRATGNVLTNDDKGADDGSNVAVTTPGTYNGTYGTLVLAANGSYTYTRNGRAGGTDRFDYTMRDHDGDTDTAQLSIAVTANPAPPPPPPENVPNNGDGEGYCPLVLDLDGDGIELTNVENGVLFDIDVDSDLEQTAWVNADDGLLAMDRNGDGMITDRTELFGDTNGATDGFDRLDDLDSNNDGVISAEDEAFEDLVVWQDANQDGVSNVNELLSLQDIGIVSISLNADMPEDLYIEGNWISHVSSYETTDGQTHEIVDAWFEYAEESVSTLISLEHAENSDILELSQMLENVDDVTEAIQDFVHTNEDSLETPIANGLDETERDIELPIANDINSGTAPSEVMNGVDDQYF